MEFLDDIGKKIGEAIKIVGDRSQQVVEIGKINVEIGKEEATIKKLYSRIGEATYRAHCGEETAEMIHDLCQEVSERQERIYNLKNQIQKLKSH
jgi:polyhydroxyalkanoate synthesis regulator phasin